MSTLAVSAGVYWNNCRARIVCAVVIVHRFSGLFAVVRCLLELDQMYQVLLLDSDMHVLKATTECSSQATKPGLWITAHMIYRADLVIIHAEPDVLNTT